MYKDTYPEAANRTDSIMLFGLVARELHKKSFRMEERNPHNHFIAYTAQQHYWKPVARCSLQKYGVKLHAACHDGYTSMYVYLRCPTPRKPLAELDPSPYFSPDYPKGEHLQRLLAPHSPHFQWVTAGDFYLHGQKNGKSSEVRT